MSISVFDAVVLVVLLMLSGLFSGLNLGLMSLDLVGLDIVEGSGTKAEKKFARALKIIRAKGNFLLCTLLLGNTLVNALLAVFLAALTSGVVGSIITTFLIVICGEIVPQSICSRHGLRVGYYTRHLTYLFMVITSPLSFPISWILDRLMGREIGNVYNREQLEQLVQVHAVDQHGHLMQDEITLLSGALKFAKVKVSEVMTPMERVFVLDINAKLDEETMAKIIEFGYSRVPVKDQDEIVAILIIKNLILLDPHDGTPVRSLLGETCCREPYYAEPDLTLDLMLNEFQKGSTHMAILRDIKPLTTPGQRRSFINTGLVTLEDVIEALIQEPINDETDDAVERKEFIRSYQRLKGFKLPEDHIQMSEKQVSTICEWLSSHHAETFGPDAISSRRLKLFVRRCISTTFKPKEGEPLFLWKKGDVLQECLLVLSEGRLRVVASSQNFVSYAGSWTVLGVQALTMNDFTPDFSVEVTEPVHVLRMRRDTYLIASGRERKMDEGLDVPTSDARPLQPGRLNDPREKKKEPLDVPKRVGVSPASSRTRGASFVDLYS